MSKVDKNVIVKLRGRSSVSPAFTIVELLIVIVIIGILAAITIVSYTGIANKARVSSLQADLSNSAKKLKVYHALNGTYPTALDGNNCPLSPTPDTNNCLKFSSGNNFSTYTGSANSFVLTISSGTLLWKVTESTSPISTTALTLSLMAGSNGAVSGAGTYETGSVVTITATANSGYQFNVWTGDAGCSGSGSHSITLTANTSCTASFITTSLYAFTSHTFTPAGVTGRYGPNLAQVQSAYSAQSWASNTSYLNMTTQGVQLWTVPADGTYRLTAAGSQGGGGTTYGGRGAIMTGDFVLSKGQVLKIMVGQSGDTGFGSGWIARGGGGGTFVTDNSNTPLVVAGGGGGHSANSSIGGNAVTSTTGSTGAAGNGGSPGTTAASAGGGLSTNGANGNYGTGGIAFVNGGAGGAYTSSTYAWGGFGGGGGTHGASGGGGGGGGYSGGNTVSSEGIGYGGASYNNGANQSNSVGNTGNGYVTITKL